MIREDEDVLLRQTVVVAEASEADRADWQRYVFAHPKATFFHRFEWRELLAEQWKHRPHFLIARRGADVVGVLPLALVRSRLFGTSLVSLPFCVYGGPIIDDPEVLAAALLHDVIEDTPVDATELRARFGERVTRIVLDVSDDKRLDKPVRKELQVQHAPHLPADSKLVKLADKICNLRDVANNPPSHWDLQRRRDYFAWAERVVAGLRGANAALDRLYEEAAAGRP